MNKTYSIKIVLFFLSILGSSCVLIGMDGTQKENITYMRPLRNLEREYDNGAFVVKVSESKIINGNKSLCLDKNNKDKIKDPFLNRHVVAHTGLDFSRIDFDNTEYAGLKTFFTQGEKVDILNNVKKLRGCYPSNLEKVFSLCGTKESLLKHLDDLVRPIAYNTFPYQFLFLCSRGKIPPYVTSDMSKLFNCDQQKCRSLRHYVSRKGHTNNPNFENYFKKYDNRIDILRDNKVVLRMNDAFFSKLWYYVPSENFGGEANKFIQALLIKSVYYHKMTWCNLGEVYDVNRVHRIKKELLRQSDHNAWDDLCKYMLLNHDIQVIAGDMKNKARKKNKQT